MRWDGNQIDTRSCEELYVFISSCVTVSFSMTGREGGEGKVHLGLGVTFK